MIKEIKGLQKSGNKKIKQWIIKEIKGLQRIKKLKRYVKCSQE